MMSEASIPCPLAVHHAFVPAYDMKVNKMVGIYCSRCGYVLWESKGESFAVDEAGSLVAKPVRFVGRKQRKDPRF